MPTGSVVTKLPSPFGWFAALVRPYQDVRTYNASLLFGYAGAAVARLSGSPQVVALVRGWTAPVLIVLCSVAIAVLVLRRRRAPVLEIGLLLLLFTAARQQTLDFMSGKETLFFFVPGLMHNDLLALP